MGPQVDPSLTVGEASAVARKIQGLLEGLRDLHSASIHLDLTSPAAGVGLGPVGEDQYYVPRAAVPAVAS